MYGDEDEEVVVRKAAEEAERAWREEREGKASDGSEEDGEKGRRMIEVLVGRQRGAWWEDWLDAVLDALIE